MQYLEYADEQGRPYYYNPATGVTSWVLPAGAVSSVGTSASIDPAESRVHDRSEKIEGCIRHSAPSSIESGVVDDNVPNFCSPVPGRSSFTKNAHALCAILLLLCGSFTAGWFVRGLRGDADYANAAPVINATGGGENRSDTGHVLVGGNSTWAPGVVSVRQELGSGRYCYKTSNRIINATITNSNLPPIAFDLRSFSGSKLCNTVNGGSCVNRYCHVSTPVSSDDLARIGFGVSEAKIFFAVVWHESHGKAGIVNNWDNQHVSWGLVQYAGKAGSLASLFCTLKNDAESSFDYNNILVANGIDATCKRRTSSTFHGTLQARAPDGTIVTGNEAAAKAMQFDLKKLATLMLAGGSKPLTIGQAKHWKLLFMVPAVRKSVTGGNRICDLLTSEFGIAVVVRLYNWMPAYVAKWTNEFLAENSQYQDKTRWDHNAEKQFIDFFNIKRKQLSRPLYVHGKYPAAEGYPLSFSRGTWTAGCNL